MENREKRQLEKLYVRETQQYLKQLREGASHQQLDEQKHKVLELSRLLDQQLRAGDPSGRQLRSHR
ncbi:MAG: hypothetical protein EOO16_10020 [Chitinophagaceae bacterium]|nr:MAG: hypothetical protein EOO16_10020 [Chitinophagaceae bacterium]